MADTRIIKITNCQECPHFDFDNQEDPNKWGKVYCNLSNRFVVKYKVDVSNDIIIPNWCQLPKSD